MSDTDTIRLRPPGPRRRTPGAGEDHRACRLPAHAAVQFAGQHPDHDRLRVAAVVHRRPDAEIPAGRCGLERQGPHRLPFRKCRTCGRRLLAVHPGQIHPVHLRILSGAGAVAGQSDLLPRRASAAAAADSAAAGQGRQRRSVLRRVSRRRLLPAARRRTERAGRQLDGRAAVGIQRQHRRRRTQARGRGRGEGRDRTAAVAARKTDRAGLHHDLLAVAAADLAARPDPGFRPSGVGGFRAERHHCFRAGVLVRRRQTRGFAAPGQLSCRSSPASASSSR